MGADKKVDQAWQEHITRKSIHEWHQKEYTCEMGWGFTRIDRVYSSLSAAFAVASNLICVVLERPLGISSHRPISFAI
eukprot:10339902-Karenia_brevis.AAC.1